jgi:predicted AlkP superfamily pyrophosphatase or phosphodiesterase
MRRFIPLIIASLFLQGCSSVPALWGGDPPPVNNDPSIILAAASATPTDTQVFATATITNTPSLTPSPTITDTPTITLTPTAAPPYAAIKHVIIVSYDGMRPDAIAAAPMPILMGLEKTGAYTLKALTIKYSVTLPAHASMLSGMCQAKHGVDWDVTTWYRGYSKGTDIFDLTHAAGMKSVMIVNKEKLRQLAEPDTTDVYQLVYGTEAVIMKTAIAQIPAGFDLMFIHIGSPDYRGHKFGWMSGPQLQALRSGDAALGLLLAALDQYGIRDSTLLIVTADHGGHDKNHPGTVIEDLLIPWIVSGPGVKPGELTTQVHTMDTAATAAYALHLPIPPEWDGTPIMEIFGFPAGKESVKC